MTSHAPINLSDSEIAEICAPLVLPGAQVRKLQRMGLLVFRKPNGKPLVARSEYERVVGAGRFTIPGIAPAGETSSLNTPDTVALMAMFKGGKRGAQAQRR